MIQVAYIDPSVVTYAVQAIAGVVIAVSAVVVVFWRKAKKKVSDKLGLEEKMKKEVEDEITVVEDDKVEVTAANDNQ